MQKFPVCTSKENETNEDCVKETSCSENDQLMLGTVDYPQGDYVPREEIPSPQSMSVPVQEIKQGLSTRSRGRPPKTTKTADNVSLPKVGEQIFCKLQDENDWKKLSIISKAGKSTGKNRYIMNVSYDKDGDAPFWLDFEHNVSERKHQDNLPIPVDDLSNKSVPAAEIELNVDYNNSDHESALITSANDQIIVDAKNKELTSWIENKVYSVVPDCGQNRIATRWILTNEDTASGPILKARLVAKSFQDEESLSVRSDSPTCSKESLRMVFAIIATQKWQCNCMDIKTAFLQGRNFNRLVYLTPPSEAKTDKNLVWKLNKCVYGLNDASRVWYLTVRDQLLNSGARVSKYDEAIFTWYFDGQLQGIMCTHVDDFLWGEHLSLSLELLIKFVKTS